MTFNEIPQTRVPGQYSEYNTNVGERGLSALDYKVLFIGQGTSEGTASAKSIVRVTSADKAGALFGFGSQLHLMAKSYFKNNAINQLDCIAATMDDTESATGKATGSIEVTGPATGSGALVVYIGGQRISVDVSSGDTADTIAAALAAEIAANHPDLPVAVSVATDTMTLEAKNVGALGNNIDIRANYADGEEYPDGVTLTITAMSGGGFNPDISSGTPSVIDVMGDSWWQLISMPYTDTTNLSALETELERRFGPTTQIDGVGFMAKFDTQSNLVTFGAARNSKQYSVAGIYKVPTTPFEVSAAIVGQVAKALAAGNGAEARPFQSLQLIGVLAPAQADRFTFAERDALLKNGIATLKVDASGIVRIERLITTYQTNESGAKDTAWLDVNTRFTAMYIRYDWVTYLNTKYPNFKLASDGIRVGSGQPVITPKTAKAEAVSRFGLWMEIALVEDEAYFLANLKAERDEQDPNALDWFLPCNFVNQFRVGKTQIGIIV